MRLVILGRPPRSYAQRTKLSTDPQAVCHWLRTTVCPRFSGCVIAVRQCCRRSGRCSRTFVSCINWRGLVYQLTNLDRCQQYMQGADLDDALKLKSQG